MKPPAPQDTSTHHCRFTATVQQANVHIKFPCSYFLHWRTDNNSHQVTGQHRPTAVDSTILFNEALTLEADLTQASGNGKWLRRETQLDLNLVSRSKNECVKLVGRVMVDLADVLNQGAFSDMQAHKLSYCSVDGELIFSIEVLSKGQNAPQPQRKSSLQNFLQPAPTTRNKSQFEDGQDTTAALTPIPVQPKRETPRKNIRQPSISPPTPIAVTTAISPNPPTWQVEKDKFQQEIEANKCKIEVLERKIHQLYGDLQDSRKHLEVTHQANQKKEQIIQQLKQQTPIMEEVDGRVTQYEQENQALKEQIRQLERKAEQMNQDSRTREQKNQALQRQKKEVESRQKRLLETVKTLQIQVKALESKSCELESRTKQARSEQLITQQAHSAQTQRIQELLRYKYQYQMLKELADERQQQLKEKEQQIIRLTFESDGGLRQTGGTLLQSQQVNKLKKQLEKAKGESSSLKTELSQLRLKYEEALHREGESEGRCEAQVQHLAKLEAAYEMAHQNYQQSQQQHSQLQQLTDMLQGELKDAKQQVTQKSNEDKMAQHEIQLLRGELDRARKDLQDGQKEQEATKEQLQTIKQEKDRLERELQERNEAETNMPVSFMPEPPLLHAESHESYNLHLERPPQDNLPPQTPKFTSERLQIGPPRQSLRQEAMQCQIESLEAGLAHSQTQIAVLQTELTGTLYSLRLTENTQNQYLTKAEEKQTELEQRQRELQEKGKQLDEVQKELEVARREKEEMSERLEKMGKSEKSLQENMCILEEQSQKILIVLKEKEEIQRDLSQTHEKLNTLELQFARLRDETASRQAQLVRSVEQSREVTLKHCATIQELTCQQHEQSAHIQQQVAQIEEQGQQIQRLTDELAQYQVAVARAQEQANEMEEQCGSMTKHLEKYKQEQGSREEEVEKVRKEMEVLQRDKEARIEELSQQIAQSVAMRGRLQEESQEKLQTALLQFERHQQDMASYMKDHQSLKVRQQEQVESLKLQLEQGHRQRAEWQSHKSQWQRQIAELTALKQQLDRQRSQSGTNREELTVQLFEWKEKANEQQQQRFIYQKELQEMATSYEQGLERQEALENEVRALKEEREEVEVMANRNINELMAHSQSLQEEVDHSKDRVQQQEEKIMSMQRELHNVKANLQSRQRQIQQLQDELTRLLSQKQELEKESALMQQKLAEGQIAQHHLAVTQESLSAQLQTLTSQIEQHSQQSLLQHSPPAKHHSLEQVGNGEENAEEMKEMLLKSDQANQVLEERVRELEKQLYEERTTERSDVLMQSDRFQLQEMNRIIEEQRKEIERLQGAGQHSQALQLRIRQLERNIVELEQTFRMEIERMIEDQGNRSALPDAGLTTINEQPTEEDLFNSRSQKSLSLCATPSRAKSSLECPEAPPEIRERLAALEEEKLAWEAEKWQWQTEKNNFSAEREEWSQVRQALEKQVKEWAERQQKLLQEKENISSVSEKLDLQLQAIRRQKEQLQKAAQELQDSNQQLSQSNQHLKQELQLLSSKNAEITEQLQQMSTQRQQWQLKLQVIEAQATESATQQALRAQQREEVETEKAKLEGELQKMEEQKFDLTAVIHEQEISMTQLSKLYKMLEMQLLESREEHARMGHKVRDFINEIEHLRQQLAFGEEEMQRKLQSVARSEPALPLVDGEIEVLRNQIEKGRSRERKLEENIKMLEEEIKTARKDLTIVSSMDLMVEGDRKCSRETLVTRESQCQPSVSEQETITDQIPTNEIGELTGKLTCLLAQRQQTQAVFLQTFNPRGSDGLQAVEKQMTSIKQQLLLLAPKDRLILTGFLKAEETIRALRLTAE